MKQRGESIEDRIVLGLAQDEALVKAVDMFDVMLENIVEVNQECGVEGN